MEGARLVDSFVVRSMSPYGRKRMGGARLVEFPLIGLLDTLLRFSGEVCSLREIPERPLVGPFLYISDTILNTSSILFNFSSNISFLIDCLPLLCHSPSLLLGLFRNRHCFPTAYFLYPLLFPRISSLLAFQLPLGRSRDSHRCTTFHLTSIRFLLSL